MRIMSRLGSCSDYPDASALEARHLQRTIRTGAYFAYEPDPAAAVRWEV